MPYKPPRNNYLIASLQRSPYTRRPFLFAENKKFKSLNNIADSLVPSGKPVGLNRNFDKWAGTIATHGVDSVNPTITVSGTDPTGAMVKIFTDDAVSGAVYSNVGRSVTDKLSGGNNSGTQEQDLMLASLAGPGGFIGNVVGNVVQGFVGGRRQPRVFEQQMTRGNFLKQIVRKLPEETLDKITTIPDISKYGTKEEFLNDILSRLRSVAGVKNQVSQWEGIPEAVSKENLDTIEANIRNSVTDKRFDDAKKTESIETLLVNRSMPGYGARNYNTLEGRFERVGLKGLESLFNLNVGIPQHSTPLENRITKEDILGDKNLIYVNYPFAAFGMLPLSLKKAGKA